MKKFITYSDLYRFLVRKLSYGFNVVLYKDKIEVYPFVFFDSRSLRLFGLLLSTHPILRIEVKYNSLLNSSLHAVIRFDC